MVWQMIGPSDTLRQLAARGREIRAKLVATSESKKNIVPMSALASISWMLSLICQVIRELRPVSGND